MSTIIQKTNIKDYMIRGTVIPQNMVADELINKIDTLSTQIIETSAALDASVSRLESTLDYTATHLRNQIEFKEKLSKDMRDFFVRLEKLFESIKEWLKSFFTKTKIGEK